MYEGCSEILGTYGYQHMRFPIAQPGYMRRHNAETQAGEYLGFGLGTSSLYRELRLATRRMQEYTTDSGKLEQIHKEVTVLSCTYSENLYFSDCRQMTEGISDKKLFKKTFGVACR